MVVVVTGANGQVGKAIQKAAETISGITFVFADAARLDITQAENCLDFFDKHKPNFCINTAAYTAVDAAEANADSAFAVNVIGVKNLVQACSKHQTTLIQLSTDFVFDGQKTVPYLEDDIPNPQSVYGKTKLEGEAEAKKWEKHFIIRTSWVYSEFGKNFMKTMLSLAAIHKNIRVVNDQIGSPTHANCLAQALLHIIQNEAAATQFGTYHFSNQGSCSWYTFAKEIFQHNHTQIELIPIPTSDYPTPAKRPHYSVLDTTKFSTTFGLPIKSWQQALLQSE
ncbi:MAG TPA: dTDP-4-dehydrorhamnose reductase [Flavobacterium sp.]|nr:dTDP-4-dehydrorhamnose reductase [Flavobacterium sp.]